VTDGPQKQALFEPIASMGKAFASPRRLELIDLLAQGPRTVDELAGASNQSSANASQHLQSLHAAGVVVRERDGMRVWYSLADDRVLELWLNLRDVAGERIAEVERAASEYLGPAVETIARNELATRLDGRDVVLVDVRPQDEYEAGHIEGAISIPIDDLDARLSELPETAEVIAYCRGPLCAYASQAVRRLRAAGRKARRLEAGWPEWRLGRDERPVGKALAS
jgi:rhodanese-related sulfurtransferase/predicted transcriptional regulator